MCEGMADALRCLGFERSYWLPAAQFACSLLTWPERNAFLMLPRRLSSSMTVGNAFATAWTFTGENHGSTLAVHMLRVKEEQVQCSRAELSGSSRWHWELCFNFI